MATVAVAANRIAALIWENLMGHPLASVKTQTILKRNFNLFK
jgi:hypothetical protein